MYKHRALLLLVLTAFFSISFADDEHELRHIKTVLWPQAYRTQDVELLDRLLHDSFEVIKRLQAGSTHEFTLSKLSQNSRVNYQLYDADTGQAIDSMYSFFAHQLLDGITYQLVPQPAHRNHRKHHAEEYGYESGTFIPNSGQIVKTPIVLSCLP